MSFARSFSPLLSLPSFLVLRSSFLVSRHVLLALDSTSCSALVSSVLFSYFYAIPLVPLGGLTLFMRHLASYPVRLCPVRLCPCRILCVSFFCPYAHPSLLLLGAMSALHNLLCLEDCSSFFLCFTLSHPNSLLYLVSLFTLASKLPLPFISRTSLPIRTCTCTPYLLSSLTHTNPIQTATVSAYSASPHRPPFAHPHHPQ